MEEEAGAVMGGRESDITKWFAQQSELDSCDFPIGIGDDMAQVRLGGGGSFLVTTDMLLEGSHFDLSKASIEQVGYKAMATSLSDCAAMASIPVGAVVSVGLPVGFGSEELKEFHGGIVRAGDKFGCKLIGGDITSWREKSDKLAVSVTMFSRCGTVEPIRRSGARVGDMVCVTGSLGGSLKGRHLDFEPRVKEAIAISSLAKVNSMMDISDGLSTDVGHICRASGVGVVIDAEKVPVSAAAKESGSGIESALNDGEDFELLFTLTKGDCDKLLSNWHGDVGITVVGEITEELGLRLKKADGGVVELKAGGYDHLGGGA